MLDIAPLERFICVYVSCVSETLDVAVIIICFERFKSSLYIRYTSETLTPISALAVQSDRNNGNYSEALKIVGRSE